MVEMEETRFACAPAPVPPDDLDSPARTPSSDVHTTLIPPSSTRAAKRAAFAVAETGPTAVELLEQLEREIEEASSRRPEPSFDWDAFRAVRSRDVTFRTEPPTWKSRID